MRIALATTAGAAGMLVQLVWLRIAIQWFGTSATTVAAVLATGLLGLGCGAFWFGRAKTDNRSSERTAAKLLLFAAVAILADVLLYRFSGDRLNLPLPALLSLLGTSMIALLPLNFLLGGILPLLVAVPTSRNAPQSSVGILYAAETLGGAGGALLAGFWLVQAYGLTTTLFSAACLCLLAGIVGLVLSNKESGEPANTGSIDIEPIGQSSSLGWLNRISVAILLAGVASVGLEIVWQRLLILIVGTDNHSYTIVVVSYLIGVCLGSELYGVFTRGKRNASTQPKSQTFFWLQLGIALLSLIVMLTFCRLASGPGQRWLSSTQWLGQGIVLKRFLLCTGLLGLPTILIGASFPVAVGMMTRLGFAPAVSTGRAYGLVALGNVTGVIVCGFFLIPALGLQASVVALCAIAILAGCLSMDRWSGLLPSTAAVAIACVGWYSMYAQQPIGLAELHQADKIYYYREGPANTVSVFYGKRDGWSQKMSVDGIVIGESDGGVDEKQQMLAHLPFLLFPVDRSSSNSTSQQALTIGLGTGILAGEVTKRPTVAHVTCAELSPAVIEASEYFKSDNEHLHSNSKATVIQTDGIHFLRQTTHTYDTIISDGKSRPGHAGNVAFFSRDYYQLASQRLNPQGTFVQWFSLEGSIDELKVVLKSFASTFDHTWIAIAAPDSIYLIGSNAELGWNDELLAAALGNESRSLAEYGWSTIDDFKSMAWLDAEDIASRFLKQVEINSFERPTLEKYALDIYKTSTLANKVANLNFLKALVLDEEIDSLVSTDSDSNDFRLAATKLIDATIEHALKQPGWPQRCVTAYQDALATWPNLNRGAYWSYDLLELADTLKEEDPLQAINLSKQAARLSPRDAIVQADAGQRLQRLNATGDAAGCYYKASRLEPERVRHHLGFALCLIELNKHTAAVRPLETALRLQPDNVIAHWARAVVAAAAGEHRLANQHFAKVQELDPDFQEPELP